MHHVPSQTEHTELSPHPPKQVDCRKLPQGLSEFLLTHVPAKSFSFSWTWDVSFIKPILQTVNTLHFIHWKYASLKPGVIPRISAHFPTHLFSSENLFRDTAHRRSRTWEKRTQTLRLLPTQRSHDPGAPSSPRHWHCKASLMEAG